jgi:hypothetical protein
MTRKIRTDHCLGICNKRVGSSKLRLGGIFLSFDIMPYDPVYDYYRFEGSCCVHLQGTPKMSVTYIPIYTASCPIIIQSLSKPL